MSVLNTAPTPTWDLTGIESDALRAITQSADVLGVAPDGKVYLLIAIDPPLFEALAAAGAAFEDDEGEAAEDDGTAEDSDCDEPNGDLELDLADFEPDDRMPNRPVTSDETVRSVAMNVGAGLAATPKPNLSRLPPALRKQVRARL